MALERGLVERDRLKEVVRAALGSGRILDDVTRLRGGSKKGVYRLAFDDGSSAVLYVWDSSENYWAHLGSGAGAGANAVDPFSDASGADLFEACHARLDSLGVRTPRAYLVDRSRSRFPADVAVVEDVRGETLEAMLGRDPRRARDILAGLGGALAVMHRDRHEGRGFGKVSLVETGEVPQDRRCEQVVLDRALGHLAEAASRVPRVADARDGLEAVTRRLAAAVVPREEYGLIHGELGPDHVLVDDSGHPVLIDIEGLMFFDVEWEHAFLRLRFGEHYPPLRVDGLDERRLRFYTLALHLSLVAGPLRLLDGDFPDRAFMTAIVESNIACALGFLGGGDGDGDWHGHGM